MQIQRMIANKSVALIAPNPGRFSRLRSDKSGLFSLKELSKMCPRQNSDCGDAGGSEIVSFHSCAGMRFLVEGRTASLPVGDGGIVVPDGDGYIGVQQFIE